MKLRDKTNIEICEENGINYTFLTNVVEEKNTKAKIRATLQIIAKILVGTLGPYGSTTVIQDREMRHFATKDGYDLLNKISFSDEVSRTVLDLVRQVASNQVLTVGDGSTSAITVSSSLYTALTNTDLKLFEKIAPKDVLDILKDIADFLEKELVKEARPVNDDLREIETIAMIATNNDEETGKFIKEVYETIGEHGFISTDIMEKREVDEYEVKQGIEWDRGYIEDYFADGYENRKIVHDKEPRVFISSSQLTYNDIASVLSPMLGRVCGSEKSELVIIANDYDDDVRNFFKLNRRQHLGISKKTEIVFTVVDIEQVTDSGRMTLKDLGVLLDCKIYDKFKDTSAEVLLQQDEYLGRAEKIIITKKNTQIIGKDRSEEHIKRREETVAEIKEKLDELANIENPTSDQEFDKYIYRRRLSALTNSTAIIHIAGKTITERMTRERLFEDAILASKSALKFGVIPGGNIMIPRILNKAISYLGTKDKTWKDSTLMKFLLKKYSYISVLDKEAFFIDFINLVKNSFFESYSHVLSNSYFNDREVTDVLTKCLKEDVFYNLKKHKYESIETTEVINSVDTDIQILRSVVSIIGIMATSNQMVTLNFSVNDQVRKQ